MPRLPRLTWDGHFWICTLAMPSWTGFQARGGAYGSRSKPKKGVPKIRVSFATSGKAQRPGDEQAAAYEYLVENEPAITKVVLARFLREYPALRDDYHGGYGIDPDVDEDSDPPVLPEIKRAGDLRKVMGLTTIHVLDVAKAGVAYIGFEIGCDWDDEHGAGVMLHKRRIVRVGQADVSFLAWVAEADRDEKRAR